MTRNGIFWLMLLLVGGCSKPPLVENGYLTYSTDPPVQLQVAEGWEADRVRGVAFPVISTEEAYGIQPNLFVEVVEEGEALSVLEGLLKQRADSFEAFKRLDESTFTSQGGWAVKRVETARKRNQTRIRGVYYAIQAGEQALVITGTCAEPVAGTVLPVWDEMISSLRP